ncbi:uncharacterized protein TNCV_1702491 [Trichonephila clavipes]|nr:uncharacterized protein TNCV_1702491 [Trichonephila clavipes]
MKRILLRVAKSAIMNFNQNAISTFPEPYTALDSLSYHSRWKLIQSPPNKFWNRWSTEYLTHLQTRAKWSVQNANLTENQLVLLKDPNTKPLDWPMGRILEELLSPTFPDKTYQQTRKNLKSKFKEKELNLDEPKCKHPSINTPLKSPQTSDQQSSVYLNMSSKVKLNDTKVNVQHSPSLREGNKKRRIVEKEMKQSYEIYLAENDPNDKIDMLNFVRRYSQEGYLDYINSRKFRTPKSTGAEKGCNKSEECQKSNNTVVEMSTIRNRFNHGNFKQIKRPDIDKRSMQKSLWRSHDNSNSGSSVQHSSSLPSFVTQSSEIHSTENAEVAQSNTIRASHLLNRLKDLSDDLKCNRACDNPIDDLRHNLMSHSTVKDFFTHPVTRGVLSNSCINYGVHSLFYKKKYAAINSDDDKFEHFLKCSLLCLIKEYVSDTIYYIFKESKNLETEWISTNEILSYAYEKGNRSEVFYFTEFFSGAEFLNLDTVISKLCNVGILVIYDDFRKGK